jgi:hypothetical protein
MIVHGVLPGEDPRLATMWTLLGHSETGIFVPVWVLGVEAGGANKVPAYLDHGDDGVSVYAIAKGMHTAGFNHGEVQARTLPFEEHLFDVVNGRLLPDWRGRDWTDPAAVAAVATEMKRVQERLDADAYGHLKYLYDHGAASNHAPTVSLDSASVHEAQVTFWVSAGDPDGGALTYWFDYGDGQSGSSATHTYAQAGHYLVSCTVSDERSVSQTDWLFVTLGPLPPNAPSNLAAAGVSPTQINLGWQDNSPDESDFHVERAPEGSANWVEITTVAADVTGYPDSGLRCGMPYAYRVRAHRHADGLYSGYSAVAQATMQSCALHLPLILKDR